MVASKGDIKNESNQKEHTEIKEDKIQPVTNKHLEVNETHQSNVIKDKDINDT